MFIFILMECITTLHGKKTVPTCSPTFVSGYHHTESAVMECLSLMDKNIFLVHRMLLVFSVSYLFLSLMDRNIFLVHHMLFVFSVSYLYLSCITNVIVYDK